MPSPAPSADMQNEIHTGGATGVATPPDDPSPASAPPSQNPPAISGRDFPPAWALALVFIGAIAVCMLGYLAAAVPGTWFPSSSRIEIGLRDIRVTRGTGEVDDDALVLARADPSGVAILSAPCDIRSSDYAAVAWQGADFPADANISLLWQSDYFPGSVNAAPIEIEYGRPLPVLLSKNPKWIGRIRGVALAVRGGLAHPVVVRGVELKPMGAKEILGDRAREWLAFEPWTGTSINTITGGADVQPLPLPLLLAASIALAAVALAAWGRFTRRWIASVVAPACLAFFLAGWALLDARWSANLVHQAKATAEKFGGKSWEEKRLANEDGELFAFVQKALAVLPATPVRVFVVADEHYFRDRAAYHLYPHSVFFDPRANTIPPASVLRPGDWMLVYQRRGVQYDPSRHSLRWNGTQTIDAEIKLAGGGAALFEIH